MLAANYGTEHGVPNGKVRERTEGAERVSNPRGRTTISTNQTLRAPRVYATNQVVHMAPAAYMEEDGLARHQWEERSLVL